MDLPTADTLAFVEGSLPPTTSGSTGSRVLEVGCGAGHLAAELVRAGHRVVAIDSSQDAVDAALARGIDARLARFPELSDPEPFDAILFTRSLHHIPPLREALAQARALLRPGGALIVDDFAHNRVDGPTASWAFGVMGVLRALGHVSNHWAETDDPLRAWREQHTERHALHTDEAMLEAAGEAFHVGPVQRLEYFYRYVSRHLDGHEHGLATAQAARWAELAMLREGLIQAIGLRFTGRARA